MALKPENDKVFTDPLFAKRIIDYFNLSGLCFDPCRGFGIDKFGRLGGAFYNQLPEPKLYAEIEEGIDCIDQFVPVEWSITNPPYSAKAYRKVARHCFKISNNVVFLVRLDVALGTYARLDDAKLNGHKLKEIIVCNYKDAGFAQRGFVLGILHWNKTKEDIQTKWTYWI